MTITKTTNKGLQNQSEGDTNWDDALNASFMIIDAALGNTSAIDASIPTSNAPFALTLAQYQCMYLDFSKVLKADVVYYLPSGVGGMWIVHNGATNSSGKKYTLTIRSGSTGTGTTVVIQPGTTKSIFSDGANVSFQDSTTAGVGTNHQVAVYDTNGIVAGTPALTNDGSVTTAIMTTAITPVTDPDATVKYPLELRGLTTGVAAIGIGTGLKLWSENSTGTAVEALDLYAAASNVTGGQASYDLHINLRKNAQMVEVLYLSSNGDMGVNGQLVITANKYQNLGVAGIVATTDEDGSINDGTYTPVVKDGNFKHISFTGGTCHIKAPAEANNYTMIIKVDNTSGGAVSLDGFNKVTGAITNGTGKYLVYITRCFDVTHANVVFIA